MPLTMILDKGASRPALVCDFCNEEITDAFGGYWEWNEPAGETRITNFKFIHGRCNEAHERLNGKSEYFMGIHNFMVYLLNNLNLTGERLDEAYKNTQDLSQL